MPTTKCSVFCGKWSMQCIRLQVLTCKSKWELVASCERIIVLKRHSTTQPASLSAHCPWTSRELMTKLSWASVRRAAMGFGSSFWTPVHCPVFLNSSDGTSHLWGLFSLELEESEDVEKINWAAKGWGQREREREGRWHVHGTICQGRVWGGTAERNGVERMPALEVLERPGQHDFISEVVFCCYPSRAHKPSLESFHFRRILE